MPLPFPLEAALRASFARLDGFEPERVGGVEPELPLGAIRERHERVAAAAAAGSRAAGGSGSAEWARGGAAQDTLLVAVRVHHAE